MPFCFTSLPPAGVLNPGSCPPLLEWVGKDLRPGFPSACPVPQINVITCREKAQTSHNSSLLEMPTHNGSRPSFFQMFLTPMQSRCLGATQIGWGQDKEPPSSGTSFGSAHLTHPTLSKSERKGGPQPHWRTPGTGFFSWDIQQAEEDQRQWLQVRCGERDRILIAMRKPTQHLKQEETKFVVGFTA